MRDVYNNTIKSHPG